MIKSSLPKVWLYWDAPEKGTPGYIELCLDAIKKWADPFEVIVLNKETAFHYVDGLLEDFPKIEQIAHRADYVRAACLAENGGIWLDIDTIPLAPLSILWSLVPSTGAVFYGWRPQEPSIGMIAAEPGHNLLTNWRQGIEAKLRENLVQRWAGIGYDILWPLAKKHAYTHIPREVCAPLHYTQTGVFSEDKRPDAITFPNTMMVQLYNRGLSEEMGKMGADELLKGNNLLRYLFDESRLASFSPDSVYNNLQQSVAVSSAAIRPLLAKDKMYEGGHLFNRAFEIARLS